MSFSIFFATAAAASKAFASVKMKLLLCRFKSMQTISTYANKIKSLIAKIHLMPL